MSASETYEESGAPTTFAYVRQLRIASGLDPAEVARRAGVDVQWFERFEAGMLKDGPSYDQLLSLIAATQPDRPPWWDSGHEHDLHLPPEAVRNREALSEYWQKIDDVRAQNRRAQNR